MRCSGKEQAHSTEGLQSRSGLDSYGYAVSTYQVLPYVKTPFMLLGVTAVPDWRRGKKKKVLGTTAHYLQCLENSHDAHMLFYLCEVLKKVSSLS